MGRWTSVAPKIILRKKCIVLIYMVVIGALLALVINRLNIDSLAIKLKATTSNEKSMGIPRCDLSHGGELLDRNNFVYNNSAVYWSMATPKEATNCHLQSYTRRDAIICLDSIDTNNVLRFKEFYKRFVFIGDSRGRQQFFNFLRFISNYDLEFEPQWDNAIEADVDLHIDRNVTSRLLGLQVSYLWHPRLDEEWIKLIKEWLDHPPYLILISMGVHHLMEGYDYGLELLQKRLINFLPSLRSLANRSELIWMNQYPMIRDSAITSRNIQKLNEFVRPLLQNSGVKFWDSGNPPVEEYARSCGHLEWTDRRVYNERAYRDDYVNCHDMIHPGYVALSHATQILLNHLCNRYSYSHSNVK